VRQTAPPRDLRFALVGALAVASSAVYLLSDLLELRQGGFSTTQLALTYAAEAAIPFFVAGLYAFQLPKIGRVGLVAALAYAYAFVFFTGTVVYALVDGTSDWEALTDRFGAWIAIHSVIMVVSGVLFGFATIRTGVLPRWTGVTLILGMLLMTVATGLPEAAQTAAGSVRDLAFAGMGGSILATARGQRRAATRLEPHPA
jgi:hypothetical protein